MPEDKLKGKIYKEVLAVIGLLLTAEIILGVFFTKQFGLAMSTMLYWVGDNFVHRHRNLRNSPDPVQMG